MIAQFRAFLYLLLESDSDRPVARGARALLTLLICVNVAVAVLDTVAVLNRRFGDVFYVINLISLVVFGAEYLARIWVCVEDGRRPVWGRITFAFTPMMLIDLIAITPAFFEQGSVNLWTVRVFRLLRLLKLSRHSRALHLMVTVIRNKERELGATVAVGFLVLIAASSVVYYLEYPVQPEQFSSIPATMWWGVATLTTAGYGDMVPVTPLGKIVGGIVATIGVGMYALPAAILSSGLMEQFRADSKRDEEV